MPFKESEMLTPGLQVIVSVEMKGNWFLVVLARHQSIIHFSIGISILLLYPHLQVGCPLIQGNLLYSNLSRLKIKMHVKITLRLDSHLRPVLVKSLTELNVLIELARTTKNGMIDSFKKQIVVIEKILLKNQTDRQKTKERIIPPGEERGISSNL